MDAATILQVFNSVISGFGPALSVALGVVLAGAGLVWIIKRFSGGG